MNREFLSTERRILTLLYQGKTIDEILDIMQIPQKFFDCAVRSIMNKADLHTWNEVVEFGWTLEQREAPEPTFTKEEQTSLVYLKDMWSKVNITQH